MFRRPTSPLACAALLASCALACAPPATPAASSSGSLESEPLPPRQAATGSLFRALPAQESGVQVTNEFHWDHPRRHLYEHGFAGGGVAIGDVDGDGRPDLFLTRQTAADVLYRQVEPLRFEDVSQASGLALDAPWSAGAAFADVDGDGHLDLYVCHYDAPNRLYKNRGDGTFEEQARPRGLDVRGASVMASFADYDRDGDLDLYLVTNRLYPGPGQDVPRTERVQGRVRIAAGHREAYTLVEAEVDGELQKYIGKSGQPDRLLRNDGRGHFEDVTEAAGLLDLAAGLSATWWDFDDDGWPDLYVSNDYFAPDRLYRNGGDGSFRDVLPESAPHTPWFSMGSAAADLDGDGRPELLATDMAPRSHVRAKLMMGDMDRSRWFLTTAVPRQYMRNTLLRHSGTPRFMEVAHLAGLDSTDWTWCVKLADLDEDGRTDAFFTNGSANNTFDPDLEREVERLRRRMASSGASQAETLEAQWALYRSQPPRRETNLAYRNAGELRFEEQGAAWGLDLAAVSFGAALGDLDRDGDLDLVVSSVGTPVTVYENQSHLGARVRLRLVGRRSPSHGTGARVELRCGATTPVRQLFPSGGFLSSDDPELHVGLGDARHIDALHVRWPSGGEQRFEDLGVNRAYRLLEPLEPASAPSSSTGEGTQAPLFERRDGELGLVHRHRPHPFDDYARQPLLPARLSQLGPGQAWGDVDGDGLDELYVGGTTGEAGTLFGRATGSAAFAPRRGPWGSERAMEDTAALFLDADLDGDLDLFVASGGVVGEEGDAHFADRLYLNDGAGRFQRDPDALPELRVSSGAACAADLDGDGDLDLFVGGRSIPGRYPRAPASRLLRNDGGRFVDVTAEVAPGLERVGMVSSALWLDVDAGVEAGRAPDLVLACEWGPISLWHNEAGRLVDRTREAGLADRTGWWNGLAAGDVDADGDLDLVATNAGLNTKYHASPERPARLYHGVFDDSGRERLLEAKGGQDLLPVRGLSCSAHAIPAVRERMPTFTQFAHASLPEIYTDACLERAHRSEANELASGMLINESDAEGGLRFRWRALPRLAQAAPGYGVLMRDLDADGCEDVYLVQNAFHREPETGRWDGGLSLLLRGDGAGGLEPVEADRSGLVVPGDATSLACVDVDLDGRADLSVLENDGPLRVYLARGAAHALCLRLVGPAGNPSAVGARVTLLAGPGAGRVFELQAGSGYLAQSAPEIHLARPADSPLRVAVEWPDGSRSTHTIAADQGPRVSLQRP